VEAPAPAAPAPAWWSRLVREAARTDWRPDAERSAEERLRALSPVELARLRHGFEALELPAEPPEPPAEGEPAPAWWRELLAAMGRDGTKPEQDAATYRASDAEGRRWLLESYLGTVQAPGWTSADPLVRAGAVLGAFFRRWDIRREPTRREVGQALAAVEHSGAQLEAKVRQAMTDCQIAVASSGRVPRSFGFLWMHLQHVGAVERWEGPPVVLPPAPPDPA
jgi:hypothetical protein